MTTWILKDKGYADPSSKRKTGGFWLHFADSTYQRVGDPLDNDATKANAFYSPIAHKLVGFKCSFHESPHSSGNGLTFDKSYGCFPIDDDLTRYSLDNRTINAMSTLVNQSSSQDITFTVGGSSAICNQKFTLTPAHSFLSINGFQLTLATTDPNDVGTYSVDLKVELTDYPTVASITKNFQVTITCQVLSLTFDAATPNNVLFRVGVDTQPFSIAYSVTKTPACLAGPAFTLTPGGLSFLSNSPGAFGGSLIISGATPADADTYSLNI